LQNLYGVLPYYDYKLDIDENNVLATKDYDQDFFNQHVQVNTRGDSTDALIKWVDNHIYFAPYEKSLVMSQVSPYLEGVNNNITMLNGRFDIGKYFRYLNFVFYFNEKPSSFVVDSEAPLYYLRFHTDRPIVFKQFYVSFELSKFYKPIIDSAAVFPLKKGKKLSDFYDIWSKFGFKKKIIKMIEKDGFN
tara:strand:+ start:432 stop:1001 length:570 start_codon:yes stop_codon:yes gene_type:complete